MTTSVTVTKKDDSAHKVEVVVVGVADVDGNVPETVYGTLVNREDCCLVTLHSTQSLVVREVA
jgi:hypothetical protein